MIYKMSAFKGSAGWYTICEDLIGKGKHGYWNMPAIVLGIPLEEFTRRLVQEYKARIRIYTNDRGTLSWIGYFWENESDARRFVNAINLVARQKKIMI